MSKIIAFYTLIYKVILVNDYILYIFTVLHITVSVKFYCLLIRERQDATTLIKST
jgi:hypothetical protein